MAGSRLLKMVLVYMIVVVIATIFFLPNSTDRAYRAFKVDKGHAYCLAFTSDGRRVAVGSGYTKNGTGGVIGSRGTITVWDIESGEKELRFSLEEKLGYVQVIEYHPDGTAIAVVDGEEITLWDAKAGKFTRSLGYGTQVVFAPDGKKVIASTNRGVRSWDLATGIEQSSRDRHKESIVGMAVALDRQRCATASQDGTVLIWDTRTLQVEEELHASGQGTRCIAFSTDGRFVACGGDDRTVLMWDLKEPKLVKTFKNHSHVVWSLAFSPKHNMLAAGCHDGTIALWDVNQKKVIRTISAHTDIITAVKFSPSGSMLGSACHDGTVKLWFLSE